MRALVGGAGRSRIDGVTAGCFLALASAGVAAPELFAGTPERHLDGFAGHAERLTDLLAAEAVDFAQDKRGALLGREAAQRLRDKVAFDKAHGGIAAGGTIVVAEQARAADG